MDRLVEVAVKSAWWSKINWANAIAMLATVGTVFGMDVPPEMQVKIVATIGVLSQGATVVLRTWFTDSVTTAVADKIQS